MTITILKFFSVLFLLVSTFISWVDFIKENGVGRVAKRTTYLLTVLVSLICLIYLFTVHGQSFFNRVADFLWLLSNTLLLTVLVGEFKAGKKSLAAFTLPFALVLDVVSILGYNQDAIAPSQYRGFGFLLHICFMLFAYTCASLTILFSQTHTISISLHKKKHLGVLGFLSKRIPSIYALDKQTSLFLILTVISLTVGMVLGLHWFSLVGSYTPQLGAKITVIALSILFFSSVIYGRIFKGMSYKWSNRLIAVGGLLLVISLSIGKHGI